MIHKREIFHLKMILIFMFISVITRISDGFIVKGPSDPLVVPLGGSVVLPCSVDTPLPVNGLKVVWRRTDSDTLVHLFVYGESRPEAQQQYYHDRAHFFTDQIQHGNFSLLLNNVRAEDKGEYMCKVYRNKDSGQTLVEIKAVGYLVVSGSDHSISAYMGDDVTLNCSVYSHITPEEHQLVLWMRIDKNIPVLLFVKNKTVFSHEQYRDRAEFFTAEIPKGNFSLRLKSVRTEDKGVYMCYVISGNFYASTTVIMERLGFSTVHIMLLILCITASGSALLFSWLIYCRLQNEEIFYQAWLVFFPNIVLFLAFVLWGVSEGFVNESVCCCALYLLRPNMLIRAAPFIKPLKAIIDTWIMRYEVLSFPEYFFTGVVSSVLCKYGWQQSQNCNFINGIFSVSGILILSSQLWSFVSLMACVLGWITRELVQVMACVLVWITCEFVQVFLGTAWTCFTNVRKREKRIERKCRQWDMTGFSHTGSSFVTRREWCINMIVVNVLLMCLYISTLEHLNDFIGWICVIVFQSIYLAFMDLKLSDNYSVFPYSTAVYLFGAVGVVFLNSFALMTELLMKIFNGGRAVGDLRIIVFPSESFFTLSLLILQLCASGKTHVFTRTNHLEMFVFIQSTVMFFWLLF
ncbi:uncharacterized protein LOC127449835 [Myxocyprinus asiaticus]|uniref:uncharacterized protein LOC127449835 n=1 Tax=Myxocyprinus asiaticus TaxID=70543 RepID=UPI002222780A|nr:uncharacterized protein LOC127449835 [Myxocyprinus asiaticus]